MKTAAGWMPMSQPHGEARARMNILTESPTERFYDSDGETVKEDVATGRWFRYDPSRDPKEEGQL
jgi:hypothetical protein